MRDQKMERLSFGAIFLSLVVILLYLALSVESAREQGAFWDVSHRAATAVATRAMKGLFLTALLGFSFDWYLKRV